MTPCRPPTTPLSRSRKQFNEVMTAKAWYIPIYLLAALRVLEGRRSRRVEQPVGNFDVPSWKPKD